jgi:hypothetical protein
VAATAEGSLREALVGVAQDVGMQEFVRSWNVEFGVSALLADVDRDPVAAALWEVLWRFEPSLNTRLDRPSLPFPNPFLREGAARSPQALRDWPHAAAEADPDAARLLATAIRVEADPDWPDAAKVMGRYKIALTQIRNNGEEREFGDYEPALATEVPPSLPAEVEHLQQMITRLLLLGDPERSMAILRAHAGQIALDVHGIDDPSGQQELILDLFVPPLNLTVDRFVGVRARVYVPPLLGVVATVRHAVTDRGARFILRRQQLRLLTSLAGDVVRRPLPASQPAGGVIVT